MSKPLYWVVFVTGQDPQRFTYRAAARAYAASQKMLGRDVVTKAVGF